MRRTSLDELCTVIGLLIYGGVFESSHEHTESLYKIDGTGRCFLYSRHAGSDVCKVQSTVSNSQMDNGMINIAAVNALVIYANNMRKDQSEMKIKKEILFTQNCT
jgi:hypothetical protein